MTTTDTDALTEKIEETLWGLTLVYDTPHGGTETGVRAPVHKVVAAVLPIIRAQKAEAWREGFDAGERDVWEHEHGSYDDACIPNPYRDEESTR